MRGEIQDQVLLNSSLNGFLFKIRHAAVMVAYHWPRVHTEASVLSSGRSRAVRTSLTGQIWSDIRPSNWLMFSPGLWLGGKEHRKGQIAETTQYILPQEARHSIVQVNRLRTYSHSTDTHIT